MKKTAIILFLMLIVACGVGGVAYQRLQAANEAKLEKAKAQVKVARGDLIVKVVETGTIDAIKAVEVRSRASGRLARLLVEEGQQVRRGELIAIIDPQETELRVRQDRAQLRGAQSAVARTDVEIEQRRITARASLQQAQTRLAQLRSESQVQPAMTRSAIASAEAALNSAIQERERLRASVQPNARTAAESSMREAQANFENAQRDFTRQQELLNRGYVAAKSLENAQLALDLARVRLQAAQDNLSRIGSQLELEMGQADQNVRRLQAELDRTLASRIQDTNKRREYQLAIQDVEKARASLRDVEALNRGREQGRATVEQLSSVLGESQRQLGETKILAPVDGVITKKLVQEGELVASLSSFSSGTPIVRIEDRRALRVKLDVNEIDVAKLRAGMDASIEVDAFPGEQFRGRIHQIAPASNNLQPTQGQAAASDAVVKYQVEVWMTSSDPRLRSGMSAKCSLVTLKRLNTLLVPQDYVGKDDKGRFLMVAPASKGAAAKRVDVTIGAQSGAQTEITSGVTEGTLLVKPEYKGPGRKGMMEFNTEE